MTIRNGDLENDLKQRDGEKQKTYRDSSLGPCTRLLLGGKAGYNVEVLTRGAGDDGKVLHPRHFPPPYHHQPVVLPAYKEWRVRKPKQRCVKAREK